MTTRPLLFLDVDGVINCWGSGTARQVTVGDTEISVPPGTEERVRRLAETFEIVWATTWGEAARLLFDGNEREVLEFAGNMKLPAIAERAGETPWVWIDDTAETEARSIVGSEILDRAHDRRLLITTDPAAGITDHHVEKLLAWGAVNKRKVRAGRDLYEAFRLSAESSPKAMAKLKAAEEKENRQHGRGTPDERLRASELQQPPEGTSQ